MLTLISHNTGKFELKIYYSSKMTERPVDYTLHNIGSTLCIVEVIEALDIAFCKTALPCLDCLAILCSGAFLSGFLGIKYLHATVFDQCYL